MKTHTIRNKSSPTPVLTFAPKFFEKVQVCHPEAVSLALNWFKLEYKRLTGKTIRLDHEQTQVFLKMAGADERGLWVSKFSQLPAPTYHILSVFATGFAATPSFGSIETALEVAQAFYETLEKAHRAR